MLEMIRISRPQAMSVMALTLSLVITPTAFTKVANVQKAKPESQSAAVDARMPTLQRLIRARNQKRQPVSKAKHGSQPIQPATRIQTAKTTPPAAALFNVPLTYFSGANTSGGATGDFNGDGIPDVAVTNVENGISVMLGNGDGSFQAAVEYTTNNTINPDTDPQELAIGDFNNDGKLDIIAADFCPEDSGTDCTPSDQLEGNSMVSVFLGNGDGTFQPPIISDSGPDGSFSVQVGDFNRDGKLDAVVTNTIIDTAVILLGNGDGTFQSPVTYSAGSGSFPIYLSVADLNKDGKLDLVIAGYAVDQVEVLLGNGDGTFPASPVSYPTGGLGSVMPVVGDFNGDGNLDVAVTNDGCDYAAAISQAGCPLATGTVSVLLGKGDGTFQSSVQYLTGYGTWGIAAVDFNGDGKTDLAVTNQTDTTVGILLGKGNGSFQAQTEIGAVESPEAMLTGFFSGEKLPDLLASSLGSTISLYKNNGSGAVPSYLINGNNANTSITGVAADFNDDGKLDLAVVDAGGVNYYLSPEAGVTVMSGAGDGTFPTPVFYGLSSFPPFGASEAAASLVAGDFRNTGLIDLVVGGRDFGSYLFTAQPDGTFVPSQASIATTASVLGSGDFNNDGNLDLVTVGTVFSTQAQGLNVIFGNGDGTFQAPIQSNFEGIWAYDSMVVGDFNGDGYLDIALPNRIYDANNFCGGAATYLSCITVLLGNGHGSFQYSYLPALVYPDAITTGDVNGDGKPDLVVSNFNTSTTDTDGAINVYIGNGDGTFQLPVTYPSTAAIGGSTIKLTDLNGDGKLDVVFANTQGNLGVMLGNGNGSFQPYVGFAAGFSYSLVPADFNGDGAIDMAIIQPNEGVGEAGEVNVLLNTLGGTLQPRTSRTSLTITPGTVTEGAGVVLRATVSPVDPALIGKVMFKYGSDVLGSCVLTNGTCTYAASSQGIPPGKYGVTATYPGNSAYSSSVSPTVNVVVGSPTNIATTTTLTATPNAVAEGGSVTLTAIVSATSGGASGTVNFKYGNTVLGSCILEDGGCTYTASSGGIRPGTYAVTATYTGATDYVASTSAPLSVVVGPAGSIATTTALTATPNSVVEGSSVALSATVTAASGTATGTVTFLYGSHYLGSCTLSSGTCTYTAAVNGIPPGSYNIVANFVENAGFLPSSSTPANVVVSPSGDAVHFAKSSR